MVFDEWKLFVFNNNNMKNKRLYSLIELGLLWYLV